MREDFFLGVFLFNSLLSVSPWSQCSQLIVTRVGNSSEPPSAPGTGTAILVCRRIQGEATNLQMQTVTQPGTQGKGRKVQLVGVTRLLGATLSPDFGGEYGMELCQGDLG